MTDKLFIYMTAQEAVEAIAQRVAQLQKESKPIQPISKSEDEKPMSIGEVCEMYGITPPTLREWRVAGKIPYYQQGKRIYFFRSELMASLKQPKRGVGSRTRRFASEPNI